MPFGLWARTGPRNHELHGLQIPHDKGQFWGKGPLIVKYRDFLPWAVRKRLDRLICHLGCGLGWAELSTSSIIFATWCQCAQFQSYSQGGTSVPDDSVPWAVQKPLNRSICHLGCGLWWTKGSTSSVVFTRWCQCAHVGGHLGTTSEYDWTVHQWQRCGLMLNYFDHLFSIKTLVLFVHNKLYLVASHDNLKLLVFQGGNEFIH